MWHPVYVYIYINTSVYLFWEKKNIMENFKLKMKFIKKHES